MKKVDPYTLSVMVNTDSKYSMSCSAMKYIPSMIVSIDYIKSCRKAE